MTAHRGFCYAKAQLRLSPAITNCADRTERKNVFPSVDVLRFRMSDPAEYIIAVRGMEFRPLDGNRFD